MMHMISTLIFMAAFTCWLAYETKRPVKYMEHAAWIGAALFAQLIASIASIIISGQAGNFVLHAVGGGVASTMMYIYLVKTFEVKVSWRIEIAMLFAFASSLGVMNELAEYFIEIVFGLIMSVDTRDTWRDFVANTSGAIAAWAMLRNLLRFSPKRRKLV
jgi:hypothetical protein